jgi:DNA-binding winged helix-turn-helix (wHTH) protein/Tfp pilus assembly protein PilF
MTPPKTPRDGGKSFRLVFDCVVVDRSDFTVFRDHEKQPLAPLAFDILLYLIQHRERVVSKEELFAEIWKERFVSDNALTRNIADIRHALGDRADAPRYIATVPKRGYRFIAELTEQADDSPTKAVVEVNGSAPVSGTSVKLKQSMRVKVFPLAATRRILAQILIICVLVFGGLGAYVLFRKSRASRPVYNPDAHALYLKGRERIETMDSGEIEKGGEYFRQAISLAPNYALAHAGMADYYILAKRRNDPEYYMSRARESAKRALALDDTVAEAHVAMGKIIELYDWDLARAEKKFERALELDSQSSLVRQAWINHLAATGRAAEALTEGRKALERDPLNVRLNLTVGWILYSTRQYPEAANWFQKMIDSGVYVPGSHSWLAQVYAAEGRLDSAVEADLRYRVISGTTPAEISELKNAFAMSGWKGYLRKLLEQRTGNQGYIEPYVFAVIYARLGEKGLALAWLEKSARDRSLFMTRLSTDPTFDDLHTEPRFQDLLRRVGLFKKSPQS